jgi:hypothetical protein
MSSISPEQLLPGQMRAIPGHSSITPSRRRLVTDVAFPMSRFLMDEVGPGAVS